MTRLGLYCRKNVLALLAVLLMAVPAIGQQAIFTSEGLASPQINEDNSVTFRIYAPKAVKVEVCGDFLVSDEGGWGSAGLTEGGHGVWSWTSAPLASELYSYAFVVDGLRMLDPSNVFLMRDVRSLMNIFIVPGERGALYSVNDDDFGQGNTDSGQSDCRRKGRTDDCGHAERQCGSSVGSGRGA